MGVKAFYLAVSSRCVKKSPESFFYLLGALFRISVYEPLKTFHVLHIRYVSP